MVTWRADLTVTSFRADPSRLTSKTSLAGGGSLDPALIELPEVIMGKAGSLDPGSSVIGGMEAALRKKVPTLSTETGVTSLHPCTLTTTWWILWLCQLR